MGRSQQTNSAKVLSRFVPQYNMSCLQISLILICRHALILYEYRPLTFDVLRFAFDKMSGVFSWLKRMDLKMNLSEHWEQMIE